ncbi:MAG: phage tail sheath subtilisin-like domain-containing protein [Myxococcales bacterium]|nr:MAG: phage tail sheath subtilisin-like domain-containing protein [Myxococcales bacterium]
MATSIFFNGRLISVPGSYSEVDASGLEQVGLGAAGIVAVLGTAVGGKPVTALESIEDFIRFNKPESARRTFRSGDLREASDMLFAPGKDPDILGGAVEVIAMKVNPATQSAASFANVQGPAMDVESVDYGAFTEQINVDIQDGTVQGKLLTITFEDVVEAVDDLGGDEIFTMNYVAPIADGWATMTAEVAAGGVIKANGTRGVAGLDGDVTPLLAQGPVRIVSSNSGDTNDVVIYGLDASGNPVSETLTLTGTVAVDGSQVFGVGKVLGARAIGTTAGTVTISDQVIPTTIMTLAAGADQKKGLHYGTGMWVGNDVVSAVADGATTKDLILVGTSPTGTVILEKLTLTGAVAVTGSADFASLTAIVTGEVEAARTVTLSAVAVQTTPSVHDTLQKAIDYFNARQIVQTTVRGFVGVIETLDTGMAVTGLDVSVSAQNCFGATVAEFYADLWAVINWINTNSELITASMASGATGGAPSNTTSPVFLQGGVEGTPTSTHWQDALDWLKRIRVNTIVPLTGDPAVHAAVDAHCAYMGGVGRNERDAVVGVQNSGLTDVPTKAEAKAAIVDLNSRHIRAVAQAIERFGTDGTRQEFQPHFLACVIAGMQAGSDVGTPLTYKYTNTLAYRQDSSWNPVDDAEELVQAGLCFLENVEGQGRRVVRNITTHRSSNNLAFTEGSVNEAVNYAAYNFRTNMEFAVGRKGFSGTVNAGKSVALNTLGLLVDETILVAYRSLAVELIVDVMEVECEIAPVLPINFVKNTLHLVTVRQSAA